MATEQRKKLKAILHQLIRVGFWELDSHTTTGEGIESMGWGNSAFVLPSSGWNVRAGKWINLTIPRTEDIDKRGQSGRE